MPRPASYQAQQPAVVAAYGFASHPTIAQVYRPDGDRQGGNRGWKTYPLRKRISRSWARRHLRPDGVTVVALTDGARTADFRIQELCR
jgi:hypothetical protein